MLDVAPKRVLLVEDDEEDYLLTKRLLSGNKRARFEVQWVRSADRALEELVGSPPDVCLMDYRLGAESGLALIERAIAAGYRGPMILLTGRGDHEVDVEAMKAGAADYLVKDEITAQLLERVIRHAIERKTAAEELRMSEAQLRQIQKMEAVGSLAGGLAHDLNNILSVILSYSDLLADELQAGDPMRADLAEIHTAGLRAVALTRQLLAFSHQQILEPKIVDLSEICASMEKMLRRVIGADVELTSLAPPALGKILVDPGQMEQIIMNLVVNARDAMPGGGQLTIETANVCLNEADAQAHVGVEAGPHVMLSVGDTGTGMDKATQARMFEPFFTTKEVGKGTGLGLATVFGIVKQSGGAIWATSEIGKGTTFKTYFPLAHASAATRSRPPESAAPDRNALRGSETILVVEDDERVRALACTILRKFGYQVLEAQSSGDALIICEQHVGTIDLLVADVVLPRINGAELAARMAASRPETSVLFMSGYSGGAVIERVHASGAHLFQKPMTPERFVRHVREVLDESRKSARQSQSGNALP